MKRPTTQRVGARLRPGVPCAAVGAFALTLLSASQAFGFCRATSCDPSGGDACTATEDNCIYEGVPLGWSLGAALRVGVDEASADAVDVPADKALAALDEAAAFWTGVQCEKDGAPSISLSAAEPGDSLDDFQVLLTFRGDDWPYEPMAVAKTTLTFGEESGQLSSAHIEMNAVSYVFSTTLQTSEVFLTPVLVHELGHVLGLDHTLVTGATMQAVTASAWSDELLSLEQDDRDGVCSLYPPLMDLEEYDLTEDVAERTGPDAEPKGCAFRSDASRTSSWTSGLVVALLALAVGRRRAQP